MTGTSDQTRQPGLTRSQMAIVSLMSVSAIFANASIAPALPDIADAFDLSDSAVVFVLMTAHLPGLVLTFVIGVAADRFGRRPLVVACLTTFGLGGIAAMLAPTYLFLLGARVVQGFGSAGFLNLALILIGDRYTGAERTRVIGQNTVWITVGVAVLPAFGGVLTELFGWRAAIAPTVSTIPLALFAARVLPPDPKVEPVPIRRQLAGAGEQLRRSEVQIVLVAGVITFLVFFGAYAVTLPIHLDEAFGASAGVRGLIQALPATTLGLVAYGMGPLARRFPTSTLAAAGAAGYAVVLGGIALTGSLAVVVVLMLFLGAANALATVPLQSRVAGLAPDHQRGVIVAAWGTAVRVGQVSAPAVVAAVLALGTTTAIFWGASVVSAGLVVLLTAERRLLDG